MVIKKKHFFNMLKYCYKSSISSHGLFHVSEKNTNKAGEISPWCLWPTLRSENLHLPTEDVSKTAKICL